MPSVTLALKDLRLLLRDSRSAVILLLMPVALILVLGLSLGEAFGRKADNSLRISVVVEDEGLTATPGRKFPPNGRWTDVVLDDLADTGKVRIEVVPSREEGQRLVDRGQRAAVIVFGPDFSRRVARCSFVGGDFVENPINPLNKYGIRTDAVGVTVLDSQFQPIGVAVANQVTQVSLMRVVIPWMIGQAFDLIGGEKFMAKFFEVIPAALLPEVFRTALGRTLMGKYIKEGIARFFADFNFTALTWADLTKDQKTDRLDENRTQYTPEDPGLGRGSRRYQVLVPSYTVTFAFFLVLTVGWLFVAERRHGTMTRLRAAPLTRGQILLGKLIPCVVVSVLQGAFLLLAGKVVFGMSWGAEPWLLVPVVLSTSLAAVGMAMLVAGVARTETQVAVYGTLLVLVLAGVSGSLMPRDLMPEAMREFSRITPHAWALDAYEQVLHPDGAAISRFVVWQACGVLTAFGLGFLLLAWWRMRLD
jgi:ABC-type transport system involved in cytochrome c biogenesis permease component